MSNIKMGSIFTPTSNGALPPYGEPVLIFAKGVVQNITYTLDGADDSPDWFQPHYFSDDGDLYVSVEKVDGWCLVEDVDSKQDRIAELEAMLQEVIYHFESGNGDHSDLNDGMIPKLKDLAIKGGKNETT